MTDRSNAPAWVVVASIEIALMAVLAAIGGIQLLTGGEEFDAGVLFLVIAALLLMLAWRVLSGGRVARWTAIGLPAAMAVSTLLQGYPSAAVLALLLVVTLGLLLLVPQSARDYFRQRARV